MLNYRHLYYFWTVAKTGGIARAGERLNLTPQTISGQIGELERTLGTELFARAGRRLRLTAAGKRALSQAEEIFHLGQELETSLRHPDASEDRVFKVGIADVVPKALAYQLLAPVLALPDPMRLLCHEDKLERLFAELSVNTLDLVIADRRLPPEVGVKAYSHALGRCTTVFHASTALADQYRAGFPKTLDGAPMLVPGGGAALRGALDRWFADTGISPRIVGEFDDTALMKAFGQAGVGVFPSAVVMAERLAQEVDFFSIGTNDLTQYTLAVDRGNRKVAHLYNSLHPAVLRMIKQVVDVGKANNVRVCVCGEMASEPANMPVFLGLELDELSMTPQSLPAVKEMIRGLSFSESRAFSDRIMEATSIDEVASIMDAFVYPEEIDIEDASA